MKTKLSTVALAALLFAGLPLASTSAYVGVSVGIAPPAIPIYEQPYAPAPGYIWTPGYWNYADFGYYWVPGVWVLPPAVGLLWTPGYWGYRGGNYIFNNGYWGPTVGFYGGINYGYGYGGHGYYGGQWAGNTFRYNTAVTRVNTAVIHDTYVNKEVVNNNVGSRAGFNGPGGAKVQPTKQEQAAATANHVAATPEQQARVEAAKNDPALHAKNNKGKPDAEAVKSLDRNNGGQAAAGNPVGAQKQAGVGEKADAQKQTSVGKHSGQKANGGAAQSANRSHTTAQATRTAQMASSHAGQPSQVKHNKKVTATQSAQHAQLASHPPQGARTVQGAPAAGRGAPAHSEQPGKKKKKHGQEGPDGGR